ncbi:MAG: hypothetical protein ACJ746_18395 [Bryobacteraceae bacterium]
MRLQTGILRNGYGWNVKPQAILHLLNRGFSEVIWVDSDVIVTRNPVLYPLKDDIFVATENTLVDERSDRNALRARLWGLQVGRVLPFSLNSAVLRVTRYHYGLVERWWEMLQSEVYQESQKKKWSERPVHMLSDQDVLTALLTSEKFSSVPIHLLRRGKHIIQFDGVYGYSVAERMRNVLGGCPTFIHSCAGKPWSEPWRSEAKGGLRNYIKQVYLDTSPYTLSALQFRDELGSRTEWMDPHYKLSRSLRLLGMGYPALAGLPVAVFSDVARALKRIRKLRKTNFSRLGMLPAGE